MRHRPELHLDIELDNDNSKEFWWVIYERDAEGSRLKPDYAASHHSFHSRAEAVTAGDEELKRLVAGGKAA